jgi:hypothetical protein
MVYGLDASGLGTIWHQAHQTMNSKNHDWSKFDDSNSSWYIFLFLEGGWTFVRPWAQTNMIFLQKNCHDFLKTFINNSYEGECEVH